MMHVQTVHFTVIEPMDQTEMARMLMENTHRHQGERREWGMDRIRLESELERLRQEFKLATDLLRQQRISSRSQDDGVND